MYEADVELVITENCQKELRTNHLINLHRRQDFV